MKEVKLKIPEERLSFFMELVKQLGFEVSQEQDIPEEHKKIVRDRVKSSSDDVMVPWDEARSKLTF